MNFWVKIKDDLQKGVGEGIAMVKEGASLVKHKAEEVTDEGKRRYQLYELKATVHKEISELGGMVYDLSATVKNPMLNSKVKAIKARINKLELQIHKLEGKPEGKPGSTTARGKKPVKKVTKAVKPPVKKK
ncbi:MAG: hypothetical protein EPN25_07355 [Nitrospirae bacterium]|nr:MAG: hypothetical protein EPN25_07355 [Nitrospirota bacterium]